MCQRLSTAVLFVSFAATVSTVSKETFEFVIKVQNESTTQVAAVQFNQSEFEEFHLCLCNSDYTVCEVALKNENCLNCQYGLYSAKATNKLSETSLEHSEGNHSSVHVLCAFHVLKSLISCSRNSQGCSSQMCQYFHLKDMKGKCELKCVNIFWSTEQSFYISPSAHSALGIGTCQSATSLITSEPGDDTTAATVCSKPIQAGMDITSIVGLAFGIVVLAFIASTGIVIFKWRTRQKLRESERNTRESCTRRPTAHFNASENGQNVAVRNRDIQDHTIPLYQMPHNKTTRDFLHDGTNTLDESSFTENNNNHTDEFSQTANGHQTEGATSGAQYSEVSEMKNEYARIGETKRKLMHTYCTLPKLKETNESPSSSSEEKEFVELVEQSAKTDAARQVKLEIIDVSHLKEPRETRFSATNSRERPAPSGHQLPDQETIETTGHDVNKSHAMAESKDDFSTNQCGDSFAFRNQESETEVVTKMSSNDNLDNTYYELEPDVDSDVENDIE